MTGGMTIGMISMRSEITPTAALSWVPEAESGILKIVSIGVIRKTNGSTAIVTITKRLRLNSRTSLRTTDDDPLAAHDVASASSSMSSR